MKLLVSIHKYDVFMFTCLVNAKAHHALVGVSRNVSKTGDGQLYVLVIALLYWLEGFESGFLQALLLGFGVERPVYFILKNSLKRNRPQAALENFRSVITPSDKFSFPSGHTSAAFMMAAASSYFIPTLAFPLFTWALLVGFSRVVLGVHFPTDTLVGGVLGLSSAAFSLGYMS